MEKTTFSDKEVISFITKNFRAYQVDMDSPTGKLLGEKYFITGFPTIALLNAHRELVYKTVGYTPPDLLIRIFQLGIAEANSPTNLIKLEAKYRQKPNDLSALKALITKRRYLDLDNSDLLDTLLTYLPTDSLATPTTLKLLMFCFTGSDQSTIRSRGFSLLRTYEALAKANQQTNGFLNSSEYKQALFNRVNRSLTVAEETGNLPLFEEAIDMYLEFNPHLSAVSGLKREKYLHQMSFYKQLGITDELVKASVRLCEDSLMHLDEVAINRLVVQSVAKGVVLDEALPYEQKLALCRQAIMDNMAMDLNEGAWGFYERVTDKSLLNQAITWSRQSLALAEMPNYLDTLAHLLYKTGQFDEAIAYENKAIKLATSKHQDTSVYQKALEKFKTPGLK
ncbi:hypothetical protein GCM10028809_28910 [Spirosoma gilvum]